MTYQSIQVIVDVSQIGLTIGRKSHGDNVLVRKKSNTLVPIELIKIKKEILIHIAKATIPIS